MNKFAAILVTALLVLQGFMAVPGIADEFDPHHNQSTADMHQQDENSSHQHEEGEPCRVQTSCHQCHMHMFSAAGNMLLGRFVNADVLDPTYSATVRGISHSLDTPPPKFA